MSFFKKLFGKSEKPKQKKTEPTPPVEKSTPPLPPKEEFNQERESVELKIYPRVKVDYSHSIYSDDKGEPFLGNPLPKGMNVKDDQMPVVKPLYEDLILFFAIDQGHSYKIIQNELLEKNPHLNLDILYQTSMNAVIEEIGEQIKIHGDPNNIFMITAGGNFEAAIILIDDFWNQIHQIMEGNVILSVPARDLLFICKENNLEAIAKLKEMVKGYFDNPETQGLLSKALYLRTVGNNQLKIFDTAF